MDNKLLQSYDSIGDGTPPTRPMMNKRPTTGYNSKMHSHRYEINQNVDKFKEKCAKHIILDIYMKVLPFDKGYTDNNRGAMATDIDNYLNAKNTTGLQYLKSSQVNTKAPLLEFVLRSIDTLANEYYESATEKLKDDVENGIDVPPEPIPDDDDSINDQLIDVKNDLEYEGFIDKLKKKTINKIVADISDLIKDKKDENDMTFNVKTESNSFTIAMDYITEWCMKNKHDISVNDESIGLAIRESVLNDFDTLFRHNRSLSEYTSSLRFGKGIVINESSLEGIVENFI